jgi:hypothetical protein
VADILIKGGEMETAAQELAASIHEIFAVDPVRTAIAKQNPPNTRPGSKPGHTRSWLGCQYG